MRVTASDIRDASVCSCRVLLRVAAVVLLAGWLCRRVGRPVLRRCHCSEFPSSERLFVCLFVAPVAVRSAPCLSYSSSSSLNISRLCCPCAAARRVAFCFCRVIIRSRQTRHVCSLGACGAMVLSTRPHLAAWLISSWRRRGSGIRRHTETALEPPFRVLQPRIELVDAA